MNSNYLYDIDTKNKKLRQEIVVKMLDGNIFCGKIFLGFNERIIDVMNDTRNFIPVELDTHEIVILSKSAIIAIDALQKTSNYSKENDTKHHKSILQKENKKINSQENDLYSNILKILNSNLFQEKRKSDKNFDNQILDMIKEVQNYCEASENKNNKSH
jgi:hypothetical protein